MKPFRLTLLILISLTFCSAGAMGAIPDEFLEGKVRSIESEIGTWQRNAVILQVLTFLVGALGIIIAAMQAAAGRWVKATVVVLSVASALIVTYNQTFYPADHRSFERLAKFAKHKVEEFREQVEPLPGLDDELKKFYRDKFRDIKGEIIRFEEETLKSAIPTGRKSTLSFPGISSAYAARTTSVRGPGWLTDPPQDERNFYFVGVAEGKSVVVARNNSLSNARSIATKTLENAAQKSPRLTAEKGYVADFVQAVLGSIEIANTYVAPNMDSGDYRVSTLLRLSKSVAAFNAETFFVDRGIPYDKALLAGLEIDTGAVTAEAQKATEAQRAALTKGVVYLQISREEDRPVADALRQSLSKTISAPGVEKAPPPATPNVVRYFRTEDAGLAAEIEKAAEAFMADEGYKTDFSLENLSGTKVKGAPEQIEIWLGELAAPQPRIYLEVEKGTSLAQIQALKSALEPKGFAFPAMAEVTGIRSSEARVFFYKASDAQAAESLVESVRELGVNVRGTATKITGPKDARPRHFDLRIGKDSFRAAE